MQEIVDKVTHYLFQRGFSIERVRPDLIKASQRKLRVSTWFSERDYLEWFDPMTLIDEFALHDSNALIIVAPRAYSVADEVLSSLERAKYWYDMYIDVRVYSVDVAMLNKALEEAINSILTTFIDLTYNVVKVEGKCPRCRDNLYLLYMNKFKSLATSEQVFEKIYRCVTCGLKIHRIDKRLRRT